MEYAGDYGFDEFLGGCHNDEELIAFVATNC